MGHGAKNLKHLYTLSQRHEIPYDLESEPKRKMVRSSSCQKTFLANIYFIEAEV